MSTGPRIHVYDVPLRVAGSNASISVRLRLGSPDLLLFMHGLGCAKGGFDRAFQTDSLREFSILTLDFPGHGDSPPLDRRPYSLDVYAEVVCALVTRIAPERLMLVGHSMGGAVGLIASKSLDLPTRFISIEGNLLAADCGLVSRKIAAQSLDEFRSRGYSEFLSVLRRGNRRDTQAWATWYGMATPAAVHGSARSLVEWSDSGRLLQFFNTIRHKAYCYGAEGDRISHLLPFLDPADMYRIPAASHFPMVDNESYLYRTISAIAHSTRPQKLTVTRR